MKLAIMQPYLFPYLGYFQLVAAADKFVFYDDVNYIKNGWINRNRLLLGNTVRYITVPLAGASPSRKINEVEVLPRERWLRKMLEAIRHAYARAPHYARVSELVGDTLSSATTDISTLASLSVIETSRYLQINTDFVPSSALYGNAGLNGADRVLDICMTEKADAYVNLPGGQALYERKDFDSLGISLGFIQPNLRPYRQFDDTFHPGLSIVDALMFNSADQVKAMLTEKVRA
ncbi:WbqC family protein [Paraburkholderia sediminicola]|uniref:WbqC family protein n=1 Tax=Paraburkholderia sediminicola TaxID=458836 RepID=UPI0038B6BEF6